MRKLLSALVALALAACGRPHAEFEAKLDAFIIQAERMRALLDQGVTKRDFEAQLATTTAAFNVLPEVWPGGDRTQERLDYGFAVEGWKIYLNLWGYFAVRGDIPLREKPVLSLVVDYARISSPIPGREIDSLPMKEAKGSVLVAADRYFERAKKARQSIR